jgi:hypothetical protein
MGLPKGRPVGVFNGTIMKKVYVIGGTYDQANLFCRISGLTPENSSIVNSLDQLYGLRESVVLCVGTFPERKDKEYIQNLLISSRHIVIHIRDF